MTLELIKLSKDYRGCIIFQDVSFKIQTNDLTSILGASGSGKSTLLKILAGLETASSGEIYFRGANITRKGPTGDIVLVFQNYALWPHLTVLENVSLPLRAKGLSKNQSFTKARSALTLLKVSHLENYLPHQISGGQQQRVALARALAFEPKFILLDEPFANLDTALKRTTILDIRNLLKSLQIGAILVSHNVDDSLEFADSFGVLCDKKFYGFEDFSFFYQTPPSIEVAELFGEVTYFAAADKVFATRPEFLNISPNGPYQVKEIKRKQSNFQVLASSGKLLTKISLKEIPSWLTVNSSIDVWTDKILFSI